MNTLWILVAPALLLGIASAVSLGQVKTEGGTVQGENIILPTRTMDVFKGIPYAAMPGRFEKPTPHLGWEGTLKATDYRKRCLQFNLLQSGTRGSEDCLYLNIWVPHGADAVSSSLPVMVWLYGGGFMVGGSMGANFLDNYLYSGQEIADRGNVIVVTVGYRVGALGFLSTGDSTLPGNYGLWDQHFAIAWVHRNILSFGGDPDNITLFGESAGGVSVSYQSLSPHNKGLIRRAISQSGTALCPWAINRNPRKLAEEVAQKVNCPTDDTMVACLKMTNPRRLTLAGSINAQGTPDNPVVSNLIMCPVIDGDLVPDEPGKLFHNAAEIDYLVGNNDMDGHVFTGIDIPSINNYKAKTSVKDLKRLLTFYTKEKGQVASDAAFSEYSAPWGIFPSQKTIKKTAVDIGTDFNFLVPTQAALYHHAVNATTGRTYSYLFSEPNRLGGFLRPYPRWVGADHADDLQYVFGKPFTTPLAYWATHRDLSGYMIAYWTNFARTGDPNKGESTVPTTWPEFTTTGHHFLDIHRKMNKDSVGQRLRHRYVHFWTSVYPSL